jgi:D-alanine-D-alanine ligase
MRIGLTYDLRVGATAEGREDDLLGFVLDDAQAEFDSPDTIEALAETLRALGHEVLLLGNGEPLLRRLLDGPRPDLVMNIAEGRGAGRGREAQVPALLELLDIPYTGSDALALAATLDKDCAKRLVRDAGLPTPRWALVASPADALPPLTFPVILKPAYEGTSKGIGDGSVIACAEQLPAAIARLLEAYRQPVLVEEFIVGDEVTVGLLGNDPPQVVGLMRVLPQRARPEEFVYSLAVKRDMSLVSYECPAALDPADAAAVAAAALGAWRALGCRDVARIDFRLRCGVPYFLEANALPGLTPGYSDLVLLCHAMDLPYRELIGRILAAAQARVAAPPRPAPTRATVSRVGSEELPGRRCPGLAGYPGALGRLSSRRPSDRRRAVAGGRPRPDLVRRDGGRGRRRGRRMGHARPHAAYGRHLRPLLAGRRPGPPAAGLGPQAGRRRHGAGGGGRGPLAGGRNLGPAGLRRCSSAL